MNGTGRKIYKTIMLVIVTALITSLVTTILVYRRLTGITDIQNIAESGNNTGLELALSRIREMLEEEYIGELDDKTMLESAIKGYVAGVGDNYTEYYPPEEMSSILDETYGNYVGIGVSMVVNTESGLITVQYPMEGSPAEEAGIKAGDVITKVDGEEITKENATQISDKIKGEEGTKVTLEIKREGKTLELEVERRRIVISHIEAETLEDNVGYIQIKDFDGGTANEFETKYKQLAEKGITSLIIDIRDNGGGIVDESIDILDMFCEKGKNLLIVADKKENEEITKSKNKPIIHMPVVVLINENSASASEILAGALKDNGVAKLVGTKTYGKGVIQTLHQLTDGSGLKITSEEYYTPNHNKINKVGIEPDYEVKDDNKTEADEQLQKAVEVVKGK